MNSGGLFRLVYASRSVLGGAPEHAQREVAQILDASRRNNPHDGVTGALLFSSDGFAQALEGTQDAVQKVFERIQTDPRHAKTVVLAAGRTDRRQFAEWSMAYAGRIEDDRVRFESLTGHGDPSTGAAGAEQVLDLLRGVVLRTTRAFG